MFWHHYSIFLLQFQNSSLPIVPISILKLAHSYSFSVPVYPSFNINVITCLLLPMYKFTYCSKFNAVSYLSSMQSFTYCSILNKLAYLMLQLQCINLSTVPISMKQHGCWYQFTYYSTFNAVACLQLQFNVAVYLLFWFQCSSLQATPVSMQ